MKLILRIGLSILLCEKKKRLDISLLVFVRALTNALGILLSKYSIQVELKVSILILLRCGRTLRFSSLRSSALSVNGPQFFIPHWSTIPFITLSSPSQLKLTNTCSHIYANSFIQRRD